MWYGANNHSEIWDYFSSFCLSFEFSCLKYFDPSSSSCLKITALKPKSEMLTLTLMQPQTSSLLIQKKPHSKPLSWSKWSVIGTEKTAARTRSAQRHVNAGGKNPHYTSIWIWVVLEPGIKDLKTSRISPTLGTSKPKNKPSLVLKLFIILVGKLQKWY